VSPRARWPMAIGPPGPSSGWGQGLLGAPLARGAPSAIRSGAPALEPAPFTDASRPAPLGYRCLLVAHAADRPSAVVGGSPNGAFSGFILGKWGPHGAPTVSSVSGRARISVHGGLRCGVEGPAVLWSLWSPWEPLIFVVQH